METMRRVCVDFDGVLNNYKYYDPNDLYTPRDGAKEFLMELSKRFYVIIFTARDNEKVIEWLDKYDMPYNEVTNIKKPAVAYIDDRAIQFNGDYDEILNIIEDFAPYYFNPIHHVSLIEKDIEIKKLRKMLCIAYEICIVECSSNISEKIKEWHEVIHEPIDKVEKYFNDNVD